MSQLNSVQFTVPQSWLGFQYKAWEFKSFCFGSPLHLQEPKGYKSHMLCISLISQDALASKSGRLMMQPLPVCWPCTETSGLSCDWTWTEFLMFHIPAFLCAMLSLLSACQHSLSVCVGSCLHMICTSLLLCVCSLRDTENDTQCLASLWVRVCIYKFIYICVCVFVFLCVCVCAFHKISWVFMSMPS